MTNLNPCPFCGQKERFEEYKMIGGKTRPMCPECGAIWPYNEEMWGKRRAKHRDIADAAFNEGVEAERKRIVEGLGEMPTAGYLIDGGAVSINRDDALAIAERVEK